MPFNLLPKLPRKASLRLFLVIPFTLQIFLVVGLTGWISLRNGQKAVNEIANQLRTEASNRIADHLTHYLAAPQQLNQINQQAIELGLLNWQNSENMGRFFWKQMQLFNVGYVNFGTVKGDFIGIERRNDGSFWLHEARHRNRSLTRSYRLDPYGNRSKKMETSFYEEQVQNEGWFAAAAQAGRPVWSPIYQWHNQPETLSISSSYPLYDRKRQLVGVVGVDLLLTQIGQYLQEIRISPSSQTFIMERDGSLVASSCGEQPYRVVDGVARRLKATESGNLLIRTTAETLRDRFFDLSVIQAGQPLFFDVSGTRHFVRVTPWRDAKGIDWLIVVVVPESDFMSTIDANTRITILLCFLALVLATWIGLYTSSWLIQPILRTIDAAKALSNGDWDERVLDSSTEELTQLSDAFNRMATQLQESFSKLEYNAYHDALTGLMNQTAFRHKLQLALDRRNRWKARTQMTQPNAQQAGSDQGYLFAVLFLDLDYFKLVNDSLGHLAGDQLLIAVTQRLRDSVRDSDSIARFGGDEFVILLEPLHSIVDATQIASRILSELQRSFNLDGNEVFISTSIGIVLSTSGGEEPDSFLRNADIALYHAKDNGKASYEVFDGEMHTEAVQRLQLETDLRQAIERGELDLHYQPIVETSQQQICGFEALLRWQHPTLGKISPEQFIPVAEETGLIAKLGWWALRQASAQMQQWLQQFPHCQMMKMSVNLSSKQFFQADLLDQVEQILQDSGLSPNNLKLEITESLFMNHSEATRAKLKRLRSLGIQLSIDDFGTGFSSLSYLHRFPIDTLKIDRSFIHSLNQGDKHSDIVEAITVMAHKLNMTVVAEGVETAQQLHYMQAIGCEQIQGFWFSPPLPAPQIKELLEQQALLAVPS